MLNGPLVPPLHWLVFPSVPVSEPMEHEGCVTVLQSHVHAPTWICGLVTTSLVVKFDGHANARPVSNATGVHPLANAVVQTLASVEHGSGGPGSLTTSLTT